MIADTTCLRSPRFVDLSAWPGVFHVFIYSCSGYWRCIGITVPLVSRYPSERRVPRPAAWHPCLQRDRWLRDRGRRGVFCPPAGARARVATVRHYRTDGRPVHVFHVLG